LKDRDLGFRVRAYCLEVGYEVVAVIPLKAAGTIYGVLQMNCRETGTFTTGSIEGYETIARDIAAAVSSVMDEQAA
jgi:transcriptional regulator with GAF, ATPase, and Fis domain